MANPRRPLSLYAEYAGISKEAARKRLARLGIDYEQPFDFADADRRFEAARHADRTAFSETVYGDLNADEQVDPETAKHPKFIESQARREMFKANLTELEYRARVGELIEAEQVDKEWFALARLVRDSMLNIPARVAGKLLNQNDTRTIEDILESEIQEAIEALIKKERQAA